MRSLLPKRFNPKMLERILLLLVLDLLVINGSAFLALFVRFEFSLEPLKDSSFLEPLLLWMLPNTLITMVIFALLRLYTSLWAFAGADELERILFACVASAVVQMVAMLLGLHLPRSYPVLYGLFLMIMTTFTRFAYRFVRSSRVPAGQDSGIRTMVIGAGQAGAQVIREFRNSRFSHNNVVCVIDDDPVKQGRYLMGVPIAGGREDIAVMARKYDVAEIVLAIPTLSPQDRKAILELCGQTGRKLKQLPGLYQLANGEVSIQKIRDVEIEDLLGRDVVRVDMGGISQHIRGKTVLVTGGGGSIGSELCRQLASYEPGELIIFDIYENNAYAIQQELLARYPGLKLRVYIGSVRDEARIGHVMSTCRPDLVFHAAAHKHVPLMEDSPLEAVKNNVFGTLNTARAAAECGVGHFVLISTDKAVNPTNVMGASKRICEMIVQMLAQTSKTCFTAVRFGNVLGSNGSVIPLFREQIKAGGPVTVTHPEITRFFMTIPEAVSLVLQAGIYARGGEIFVLDMGKAVKIDDLARNMIRLCGFEPDVDIPIVYTGLRPGEKLYEELLMDEEGLTRTANDLIYVGRRIPFDTAAFCRQLRQLGELTEGQEALLRRCIREIVPTYTCADAETAGV